ncbi:putative reverse transcriptase domain-containing protein [Tanacetum coccineum]
MAPKKRTTRSSPATTTTTTTPMTDEQLKTLIAQGVADVLAERDATRSRNGEDSHDSGTGTEGVVELTQWFERMETVFRISNCSVENQIKFATCTLLGSSLTWWNSHVRIVGHDVKGTDVVSYNQRFQELALMYDRMFPEESDKIEKYVGGLPDMIHGSVMASKPKTMQDAIEFATELMDKKINTLAERVAIAYSVGSGERKEYAGTLPLYNKCANCKRVGHLTRDCRSPAATNNQRNLTCYECGNQGHYRSDCPELKNQNHGNQAGGLCHAESSHRVTFVNKSIFTYILEKQSSARRHLIPNPKDTSLVALGQFAIKLARQKSYADVRRKPLEFQVGDRVMLKVSPWKGLVRFGKQGDLNPRYVGPFKALAKVGAVAYKLELPQELSRVHHTFHVSNLKKCYADEPLAVPLD